eukprot:CAMPEP_0179423548 /NCGR_PEP_ID=MMETSP0799-20121207/11076_1 /TAXON_ID=46947 /ORGANISM="Geminigera cryophila, Strain CCMP2564" /LENGTH=254 /DNA_ID=CAMNT_0021197865 /DNA_START=232 /DNA_END=996 /DNA_ORIENTATION=+
MPTHQPLSQQHPHPHPAPPQPHPDSPPHTNEQMWWSVPHTWSAGMTVEEVLEEEAKEMAVQLLDGLEYLHSHHLAHRDLKPENIMLLDRSDRPRVKIADFGESKALSGEALCKTFVGTYQTMAPEVFLLKNNARIGDRRSKSIDGKIADLWGLGVVLHVMLVICYPFHDENLEVLMTQVAADPTKRPLLFKTQCWRNRSNQVKELVEGLLTAKVTDRWSIEKARGCDWLRSRDSRRDGLRKLPTPSKMTPKRKR